MSTANDDRKQETSGTAVVRIEATAEGPRLYTGDVRPGGRVVLMVESTAGEYVSLDFAGGAAPLAGVGGSFLLGSGASVEFTVDAGAEGHYPFTVRAGSETLLDARLAVSTGGSLERTGFVIRSGRGVSGSALLLFQRAPLDSSIELELQLDETMKGTLPDLAIRETGRSPEVLETRSCSIPVAGVGCVATVYLAESGSDSESPSPVQGGGKGQTGGTEQVEIVIDPDGGGG